MKKIYLLGPLFVLSACATQESQIADYLKKNPQVIFQVIEENPEKFIESVNKAARKAQEGAQEKQIAEIKQQQDEQLKNPLKPAIDPQRRLMGSNNGKIVVVEYADFQCPACRMAFENLQQIKEKYKDRVQFYYKHMPLSFHKMAYPAALYYEAIFLQDKNKAARFYENVFQSQAQMRDESFLQRVAKKVGADLKRVTQDMKSEKVIQRIASDMAEFEKLGFTGTPVILVNGVALYGAQPADEIERVIALTEKF